MSDAFRPAVLWFRRDLRLSDNPALHAAREAAGHAGVLPVFVRDPKLWGPSGPGRRAYLSASLEALSSSLGGALVMLEGDPVVEVVRAAREVGAGSVHVAADFNPYGRLRDERVEAALAEHGVELRRLGSPYAVAPGTVVKADGTGFSVFSPFLRAWLATGWREPLAASTYSSWLSIPGVGLPGVGPPEGLRLPDAGEAAAHARWLDFRETALSSYSETRNLPGVDATSRMSAHLRWGEIHPRTLLADLAGGTGKAVVSYRSELAWREFYADVLWRRPESAREYLRPEFARMQYDEPGDGFAAWEEGRTGYPIVDAGMRQMRAVGWMHNRVRMITASFLVKDLHVEWQHGARVFMRWFVDGDLASNQHGWQWVAGSGTDAAPYFRVFNPTTQGEKFDPDGSYVRRWVPELRDVDARYVHQPWADPAGLPEGYPAPILDHAVERREALARLERIPAAPGPL